MKSVIAVLTYRRYHSIKQTIEQLNEHCPDYPVAVFEDCGLRDKTQTYLEEGRTGVYNAELMAHHFPPPAGQVRSHDVFMGQRNLGVAGNSNRALKWFFDSGADHLILMNDDLLVYGNFVDYYAKAHRDLEIEFFSFSDFPGDSYRPAGQVRTRGYTVKIMPRMTGIMLSLTRKVVEKIGYFDAAFGKFGEEHCDFNIRARMAGCIRLDGQDMQSVDLVPPKPLLAPQDVQTSVSGHERKQADHMASEVMAEAAKGYRYRHTYRPFLLSLPKLAGAYRGGGIPVRDLPGYRLVTALV